MLKVKVNFFRDRIFILAILLSAVWHIFWLSMITVVVNPEKGPAVKFSNVAFLGPILERGAFQVRITPAKQSFLEKRFLEEAGTGLGMPEPLAEMTVMESPGKDFYALTEKRLSTEIMDGLSASKLEPAYPIE